MIKAESQTPKSHLELKARAANIYLLAHGAARFSGARHFWVWAHGRIIQWFLPFGVRRSLMSVFLSGR